MKKLRLELHHFFLPLSIGFLLLLYVFRGQSRIQFEIVFVSALIYLGLSLSHHHIDKSLTLEVTLEYILIAALSLMILQQFLI